MSITITLLQVRGLVCDAACFISVKFSADTSPRSALSVRLYVYPVSPLPDAAVIQPQRLSFQDNTIMFFDSFEVRILSGFWLGWSVICDVLIAAALSYYLHSKKTGFKRCDRGFLERIGLIRLHISQNRLDDHPTDHICCQPGCSHRVSVQLHS